MEKDVKPADIASAGSLSPRRRGDTGLAYQLRAGYLNNLRGINGPHERRHPSSRIGFDNAHRATKTLRHRRGTIANTSVIKVLSARPRPVLREIEPVRTTGRNLTRDLAIEYAKRTGEKASLSTSWHNDMLALSESIVLKHAAELIVRRRQLTITSKYGLDESRWLQAVECFIDGVIEKAGGHVRSSPERLQAVRWMIAGATAQFAQPTVPFSFDRDSTVVEGAA